MSDRQVKHWQSLYAAGRMSRRDFLGSLAAVGFATTTSGILLTAADAARAATPVKGGHLKLGWYGHSAKDTLNPNRLTTSLDFQRAYQTMGCLLYTSPSPRDQRGSRMPSSA